MERPAAALLLPHGAVPGGHGAGRGDGAGHPGAAQGRVAAVAAGVDAGAGLHLAAAVETFKVMGMPAAKLRASGPVSLAAALIVRFWVVVPSPTCNTADVAQFTGAMPAWASTRVMVIALSGVKAAAVNKVVGDAM